MEGTMLLWGLLCLSMGGTIVLAHFLYSLQKEYQQKIAQIQRLEKLFEEGLSTMEWSMIGMGKKISEQDRLYHDTQSYLTRMDTRDSPSENYAKARQLLQTTLSVYDIQKSCGLGHAEMDILRLLERGLLCADFASPALERSSA